MYGNNRFNDEEDWERETSVLEQRKFTREELSQYNGSGGKPAYVAVNGIVYDASIEITWGGGTHFGLYSGRDLSEEFNGCHRGMLQVLRNLPKVGVLID
jgi:predicted heme/steroid binding protein